MAKWGEGDPRWIVEERPDAANVNNWHWTEKNATPWSKDKFHHLFKNITIGDKNVKCIIEELVTCSGEATANNRKGKLIYFYEWNLLIKWKGSLLNPESPWYSGQISIPNLSEENELNDVEITVTTDESNGTSEILKEFMNDAGKEKVRQILEAYITEFKEEYSKNLILPVKNDVTTAETPAIANKCKFSDQKTELVAAPSAGCKLDDRTVYIEEDFRCSASDLYNVLINSKMVEAFTRGPATIDAIPGGEFSLYGGHVHGIFEELSTDKKIKLKWRLKSWPLGHYSIVVIKLKQLESCTQMKLEQTGVPVSEYDIIKVNWYRYYWHSIKQTFGFGVSLTDML